MADSEEIFLWMQVLEGLEQKCAAWQVVAHAKALEAEEKLADGVRDIQLAEDGTTQSKIWSPY